MKNFEKANKEYDKTIEKAFNFLGRTTKSYDELTPTFNEIKKEFENKPKIDFSYKDKE